MSSFAVFVSAAASGMLSAFLCEHGAVVSVTRRKLFCRARPSLSNPFFFVFFLVLILALFVWPICFVVVAGDLELQNLFDILLVRIVFLATMLFEAHPGRSLPGICGCQQIWCVAMFRDTARCPFRLTGFGCISAWCFFPHLFVECGIKKETAKLDEKS